MIFKSTAPKRKFKFGAGVGKKWVLLEQSAVSTDNATQNHSLDKKLTLP
jgi:hypothetical protein